jgi:hypothetical protein
MLVLTGLARASKVLTFADVSIANETVVIGTVTYTFKASVTTTANEVKVGATATISATNLASAINHGSFATGDASGSGTLWGSDTALNPYVAAVDDLAGGLTLVARTAGLVGNAIPISETGTNTAFAGGAVFLTGGTGYLTDLVYTQFSNIRLYHQINAQTSGLVDRIMIDLATFP